MIIVFKILTTEIFFPSAHKQGSYISNNWYILLLIGIDKLHGAEPVSTYSCRMIARTPTDATPLPRDLQNKNVNHAPISCELSYTLWHTP